MRDAQCGQTPELGPSAGLDLRTFSAVSRIRLTVCGWLLAGVFSERKAPTVFRGRPAVARTRLRAVFGWVACSLGRGGRGTQQQNNSQYFRQYLGDGPGKRCQCKQIWLDGARKTIEIDVVEILISNGGPIGDKIDNSISHPRPSGSLGGTPGTPLDPGSCGSLGFHGGPRRSQTSHSMRAVPQGRV